MVQLLYLAVGFAVGYYVGKREDLRTIQRESSLMLDSIGRLSQAGGLKKIEDLHLQHKTLASGMQVRVKTWREEVPDDPFNLQWPPR